MATKSIISFGIVSIPVSLHTATTDIDIHFNQLHKEDKERIRYKKTCGHCGEEVTGENIVRGYEYDKNKYVVVTDDDIEKLKTPKDKSIQILHFAKLDQISPIYYDKTYHAVPDIGGEKAFELFRKALFQEKKIAIAKSVMGTKDTLLALIPRKDGLLVQTMFYEEEIKELPQIYRKEAVVDAELALAKTLIASMDKPFDPAAYRDEYQARLRDLIAKKIKGKEITTPTGEPVSNVINLMEALQKSIDLQKTG